MRDRICITDQLRLFAFTMLLNVFFLIVDMVQNSNFVIFARAWYPSTGTVLDKESQTRQSTMKPGKLETYSNQVSAAPGFVLAPKPSANCPLRLDFSKLESLFLFAGSPDRPQLWYILATAALLAFHQAPLIGELWRYLSQQRRSEGENLAAVRQIREACLKSSVLVGFPRVSQFSKSAFSP